MTPQLRASGAETAVHAPRNLRWNGQNQSQANSVKSPIPPTADFWCWFSGPGGTPAGLSEVLQGWIRTCSVNWSPSGPPLNTVEGEFGTRGGFNFDHCIELRQLRVWRQGAFTFRVLSHLFVCFLWNLRSCTAYPVKLIWVESGWRWCSGPGYFWLRVCKDCI